MTDPGRETPADRARVLLGAGIGLRRARRLDEAARAFQAAATCDPRLGEAHLNLGATLELLHRSDDAFEAFGRGVELAGHLPELHFCLGNSLRARDRWEEAALAYARAITLQPGYAQAFNNLGTVLHLMRRFEEALAAYERALALKPRFAEAHNNAGNAWLKLGRADRALAAYERALAINPLQNRVRSNLAIAQFLTGDLPAGWRNYESRWAGGARGNRFAFSRQPWRGQPLEGRTLLVCNEQGLGDMIHFSRYLPLAAARGARVHVEVTPPLEALFRASFPEVEAVHLLGGDVPDCDAYCMMLSLPIAFGTSLDSIPAQIPYLRVPPDRRDRWRGLLGAAVSSSPSEPRTPVVGVVWSGSTWHDNDHNRSIPLATFRRLLEPPDGSAPSRRFVCLQKEIRPADAAILPDLPGVAEFTRSLGDLADTAALVSQVDLVIAVDTAVAHLAAALGRPVWLLLPHVPDWRWLQDRTDSPWYPGMRLFRQPGPGSWDPVIDQMRLELWSGPAISHPLSPHA